MTRIQGAEVGTSSPASALGRHRPLLRRRLPTTAAGFSSATSGTEGPPPAHQATTGTPEGRPRVQAETARERAPGGHAHRHREAPDQTGPARPPNRRTASEQPHYEAHAAANRAAAAGATEAGDERRAGERPSRGPQPPTARAARESRPDQRVPPRSGERHTTEAAAGRDERARGRETHRHDTTSDVAASDAWRRFWRGAPHHFLGAD